VNHHSAIARFVNHHSAIAQSVNHHSAIAQYQSTTNLTSAIVIIMLNLYQRCHQVASLEPNGRCLLRKHC
jgi:hypothetical protein